MLLSSRLFLAVQIDHPIQSNSKVLVTTFKVGSTVLTFKVPPLTKLYGFPMTSFPGKRTQHVHLKATTGTTCDGQLSNRKFKMLPPSERTHHFHSVPFEREFRSIYINMYMY